MKMKILASRVVAVLLIIGFLLLGLAPIADAGRGGGSRRGSSIGPGTGSNPRSHRVRPHIRKDGTYVPSHRRSNPNRNSQDNWTTKPNVNPYTGRQGTRVNPPVRQ
jgi:hypothetical protein